MNLNTCRLMQGDCLELMRDLPDASVDLILTDPPYFKVKNEPWDNQWKKPDKFLAWLDKALEQFQRILKPTGSMYLFASAKMSAKVERVISERFNVLNSITWNKRNAPGFDGWKQKTRKESLRQFYPHSERIIFAESLGGVPAYSRQLKERRVAQGMTQAEVCAQLGLYGKINRGGMLANWELGLGAPNPEQWRKLQSVLELPEFEHSVRPFFVTAGVQYTDVWDFETVRPYPGKHPCEKPQAMLEHIITASSLKGGVVFDAFMGTGSTGIAAVKLGRNFIGFEISQQYLEIAQARTSEASMSAANDNGATDGEASGSDVSLTSNSQ